jgi:hypothetical protein
MGGDIAVTSTYGAGDGEAQPGAAELPGGRFVGLGEALEQAPALLPAPSASGWAATSP